MNAREALERLSDRVPATANAEREYEIVDAAVAENETLRAALEAISSLPDQTEAYSRVDTAIRIADDALAAARGGDAA
jgi:hypothetical protein